MNKGTNRHNRRSMRLPGYDYAEAGAYYVTLCAHKRARLFGRVRGGVVELSDAGRIAERELLRTAEARPNIQIDAYVVMPDHVHVVFVIAWRDTAAPQQAAVFRSPSRTLGAIVRGYKGAVTSRVNSLRGTTAAVWQCNYYEHIVRNDADLDRIRRYIDANPARWKH